MSRPAARKGRDRAAIAHHYDLSNDFYQLLLDPRMAYSCGYWTEDPAQHPEYGLADAQRDKLDLICRKLDLQPGMRLLDVGCGWAALLIHAATHYRVRATGVTLSAAQREFGTARASPNSGFPDQVEIRVQDYREVGSVDKAEPFDAVSSVEMGEHVGERNYPTYAAALHRLLRPGGRIAAATDVAWRGGTQRRTGWWRVHRTLRRAGHVHASARRHHRDAGAGRARGGGCALAARALRLDRAAVAGHAASPPLDEAIALVGEQQYRVWLLYLAGAALSFEENRMGVHQILSVRPGAHGGTGLPRRRSHILGRQPSAAEGIAG